MNKRGISPLIATVLIIGITIILVTTVAFWLIPMFGDTTCSSSCDLASISLCNDVSTALFAQFSSVDNMVSVSNDHGETYSFSLVYRDVSGAKVGDIVESSIGPYTSISEDATAPIAGLAVTVDMIPFVTPSASEGCPDCQEIQCSTTAVELS